MNMAASMRAVKRQLRKSILQSLQRVTSSDISDECDNILPLELTLATVCATALTHLPQYIQSRNVSVYLSMAQGEVQTDSIVKNAFDSGFPPLCVFFCSFCD